MGKDFIVLFFLEGCASGNLLLLKDVEKALYDYSADLREVGRDNEALAARKNAESFRKTLNGPPPHSFGFSVGNELSDYAAFLEEQNKTAKARKIHALKAELSRANAEALLEHARKNHGLE